MENSGPDKPVNEIFNSEAHHAAEMKEVVNWEELYKEVYPMVLNWTLERKAPYDWAKEICQDAFLIFFRKLSDPMFRLECKPSTFVVAISKNLYLNRIRKNSYHQNVEFEPERTINDDVLNIHLILEENRQKEEQIAKMEFALNQLGEPCRELLTDFYFRNYDMQKIAEKFGYTNSDNAKTQKYKCLQRLKKYFFNQINKE